MPVRGSVRGTCTPDTWGEPAWEDASTSELVFTCEVPETDAELDSSELDATELVCELDVCEVWELLVCEVDELLLSELDELLLSELEDSELLLSELDELELLEEELLELLVGLQNVMLEMPGVLSFPTDGRFALVNEPAIAGGFTSSVVALEPPLTTMSLMRTVLVQLTVVVVEFGLMTTPPVLGPSRT